MSAVVTKDQQRHAGVMRELLAAYRKAEDLINIGAYRSGANPLIDRAVRQHDDVNRLLRQDVHDHVDPSEALAIMAELAGEESL
jgi:flagellar biosynthesis/type III secretory pathway ATPase